MAFEIRQQTKQIQKLCMTPALRQAINFLLLSRQELIETIHNELLENPFLEEVDQNTQQDDNSNETEVEITETGQIEKVQFDEINKNAEWQSYLGEFSSLPRTAQAEFEVNEDINQEFYRSTTPNLEALLMSQLLLSDLSKKQKIIGECIIGNLDETGYLTASDEEIAAIANSKIEEVSPVLDFIQHCDPIGVATRTLQECLLIQIEMLGFANDKTLIRLIKNHLDDLGENRYKQLTKILKIDIETLREYINLLRSLNPRPGASLSIHTDTCCGEDAKYYIVPDLFVKKIKGQFIVIVNNENIPQLHLSKYTQNYQDCCNSSEKKDYMTQHLDSAKWIIKTLEERQRTLYQVMESIVKFQHEFFEYGIYKLKPLVLKTIADDIGKSESSISRITTNKYVSTDFGIFELKKFFNSGVTLDSGSQLGSESIKAHIKSYISDEDVLHPLSDELICNRLYQDLKIKIARRTVAKYREELGILSSSKRKLQSTL